MRLLRAVALSAPAECASNAYNVGMKLSVLQFAAVQN